MTASLLQTAPSFPSLPPGNARRRSEQRLPCGGSCSSISPSFPHLLSSSTPASRLSMRLASHERAYICRNCGYIYSDRTPFGKLADDYFCPDVAMLGTICGAPQWRFIPYMPAVSKNANEAEVCKARKAQIKRDEAIGQLLQFGIIVGVVALAGFCLYLNSAF